MAAISPFRALRAPATLAAQVIAPPYDVLSEAESRAIVQANPRSFVRVSRPEAVMAEGADSHSAEAYATVATEFAAMRAQGLIVQDDAEGYYLYGQKMGEHEQVGLVACFSCAEYDANLVRRHEFTRPDKERDRVAHIDAANCQSGMVFLAFRDDRRLDALIGNLAKREPEWRVTTEDEVVHTLWRVADPADVAAITAAAGALPAVYVADGHHRSAAASIVHRARAGRPGRHGWFLAGLFPASSLQILAYNRAVRDLNGHDADTFLHLVGTRFDLAPQDAPTPDRSGRITMYLKGRWYGLEARDIPEDPVAALDVSLLQDRVLAPLLAIEDPRKSTRIDFVGGIRGWRELVRLVDGGSHAVAFHMFPTRMDQLLAVADAGQVMPPKSTWFEPKLRDAVAMHDLA
jgi:uncharacterized protein (DUF1015 family)